MQHRPRIYIAISSFYPLVGGAETQALMQGRSLRARGYEATIITLRYQKKWPARDQVEGVPVVRVAGGALDGRARYPRVIQRMLYLLALLLLGWTLWHDRHRYDILHVYQLSLITLPTVLACRLTGKPMLISLRSTSSEKPRLAREDTVSLLAGPLDPASPWLCVNGLTWIDGDLESLVRMGKPVVWFTRVLLRSTKARIIILSSRMRHYLATRNFLLPYIHLIHNGIDITRYYPISSEQGNEAQMHTVVCVSRLRYEKGIDVLLQAWYLVQGRDLQARLIIVGGGPLQRQFMSMVDALGIRRSIEFTGIQKDVARQLQRGGLAVLPSRWEGMPNAVLEAMACGLPCVATRVSGSEDIIQHGINGLLVEVEDYEGMAQALLTLLQNPTLTKKYGDAARVAVEQHYSLEHITDIYVNLYQSLAGYCEQQEEKQQQVITDDHC